VFNRKAHAITLREAVLWSIVWTVLALVFNAGVFIVAGHRTGLEFLTGYLIERALSFDNIFVFVLIFSYFGVPTRYHHRALFWGVVGALVTRSIFIAAGAALIARFAWVLTIFGVILIVSGWKMLGNKNVEVHPDRNLFIRAARRLFPVTGGYDSARFFERRDGRLYLTPLFLVLLTIETTDIVFAVDSIPAVFGVTQDPFIVYSSNVFAILGLRATYFLLAGVMDTFHYLSHGLSLVLIFIGTKMLLDHFIPISIGLSLGVVTLILTVAVAASLVRARREKRRPPHA
jgi:tellurite resistance protein TerC